MARHCTGSYIAEHEKPVLGLHVEQSGPGGSAKGKGETDGGGGEGEAEGGGGRGGGGNGEADGGGGDGDTDGGGGDGEADGDGAQSPHAFWHIFWTFCFLVHLLSFLEHLRSDHLFSQALPPAALE